MSTPLQRARTKLRVMYRLQQATRDHQEHGLEEGEEADPSAANGAQMECPVRPERRCHQRYKPNYERICSSCRLLS